MTDQNTTPAGEAVVVAPQVPEPRQKGRDRALGTAGQVVGIVGIIACLLLVVGVVIGRGWAIGTVDDVATAIDTQIVRVNPILAQASTRAAEISGGLGTVADLAAGIAADPSPGGGVADTLRAGLASVSDRYQALRSSYADVRENVVSMLDRLKLLDRLVPGFSIPQGPVDALAALDSRLREFDAKVNDLLTIEPGQGPVNQAAAAVAQRVGEIQAKVNVIQTGLTDVQQRIAALEARLSDTASTIRTAITLGSIVAILLLLYSAFLHWVLYRHSGEIRRGKPAA